MTLDWWGVGLQAINVLILVWLLGRLFWRPVAEAIARRQDAAQAMLDGANTAQAEVDAALAEVAEVRAGIAAERDAMLAEAKATADTAKQTALRDAKDEADTLIAAAQTAIERERKTARKENATRAADLSVEIAARLLERFDTPDVRQAFLTKLVDAIAALSAPERAALATAATDLQIVTAIAPSDAEKSMIAEAVEQALGGNPTFQFVTDPDLIAGIEVRSVHFVLHNSWRADLEAIREEVKNVG